MKPLKALLALASLAGLSRGNRLLLVNASEPNFKAMHAECVGISPDATNDEAVAAHHKHMAMANDLVEAMGTEMPPGPAEAVSQANSLIASAVTEGRVTEADKPAWLEKFAQDFDGAKVELANTKKPEQSDAQKQLLANTQAREQAFRGEVIELLLTNAVRDGRVTPATKPEWQKKFSTDYDGTKTALANAQPIIKVTPQTTNLAERDVAARRAANATEQERRNEVLALVNAEMSAT